MPLTTEQKGKLVDFYLALKSVLETNQFSVRDTPDRLTVCTERNVYNVNKGRSGRPKSVGNQNNIDAVCLSVRQSSTKSTRTKKNRKITNFSKVVVIQST